jgi:hypothetical protein
LFELVFGDRDWIGPESVEAFREVAHGSIAPFTNRLENDVDPALNILLLAGLGPAR